MTTTTLNTRIPLRTHGTGLNSPTTWLRTLVARRASRLALASLDARLLADVGLTREQAMREATKPIWWA